MDSVLASISAILILLVIALVLVYIVLKNEDDQKGDI